MSSWVAYLLGLLTLPVLTLLVGLGFRLLAALERRGFTFDIKWNRDTESISDYTLSHTIWWERSWGPVFVGGWYRETTHRYFNRWIGFGQANGASVIAYRSRDLGLAEE